MRGSKTVSAERLLSELRALDVRLYIDGERLRCSAPKGRLTRELENRIATHKLELIHALRTASPQPVKISPRSSQSATLPLSFAQERFWFLQRLEPESTAYNVTAHRRVLSRVDEPTLKSALQAILSRHEILRTNFPESDGVPAQVSREDTTAELDTYDLRDLTESDKAAAVDALIQKLSRHRFDLERDLLLRGALIRLAEEDNVIVMTMHHIVSDGWSFGVLFHELSSVYESYSLGLPAQIAELPIQFGDYVLWERQHSTAAALDMQVDFWKRKLKGAPRYLDIPLDRPRPASACTEAAYHRFHLDEATSNSLKSIARQEGCTLFMVLLAVFKALLARYTGQGDILVGTPVSTRTQPELQTLIGCFINTLVLRTQVSAELTLRGLLDRVRETVVQSLNNCDVPFERLVNELHSERDLSRSPLFQVAFVLQNTPMSAEYEIVGGGAAFDMTLYTWESNGVISGSIEYPVELFNPENIAHFAGCYKTLASEIAAHPDTAVVRLPVLTQAQWAEQFEDSQGPALEYPHDLCTHQWIEQQAAHNPENIAVVCGLESLSYHELSVHSNRLAHRLRALGVGRGSLVGLALDRTPDLLVASLAVWKAGGAYVPLDPKYPKSRLAFMLQDSAPMVLITESYLLNSLPRTTSSVICMDRDRQLLSRESSLALDASAGPDDLAYVIYTSGSTGKPKGVEIMHRSLVNFLTSMQGQPGIAASDHLLAVTTFSFDIAGLELYLPLVTGARLVLAPHEVVSDGTRLARMLRDSAITMMQATPVTWRLLLESGWQGDPGLKILCGGEALPRELADRLLATGAEVWNLYGPTETTIWSTLYRVDSASGPLPIGRPIANTQVCLIDEYGHLVPAGVVGELYIGGDGLARGYLRDPELTAAKFVQHPFHPGERLYRTGDLARRLPDGSLEYLARVDHQVKVRGFRIELGEIEAALEQQPGIRQAVVAVRDETAGNQRLTAYVTAENRAAADSRVLRKALLALLPEYMVPASFWHIKEFPLTPNNKVDRKALVLLEDRLRRNGPVEFAGHGDESIKIQGHRIVPDEIETALSGRPDIQDCAVVAVKAQPDGEQLVAYLVARNGKQLVPEELRTYLGKLLPDHKIPAQFVVLRSLPLTPSGRLDRRALALNEEDRSHPADEDVAPSNHVERVMTEIWSEVLGVEKVGLFDNFFELGGHSFFATRIAAQIRSAFNVELPLRSIFVNPTVAGLSRHICYDVSTQNYRYTSELPAWNCLVPAQPKGTRTPLFVVAGYQGPDDTLLMLSRLIPHLGLDQPVFGFRPRWIEGSGEEYESVEESAHEFLAELRNVQPKGPYLLGGHCVGGIMALAMAQELMRQGEEVRLLVLLDSQRPTTWRSFLAKFNRMRNRGKHIAEVISEVARPNGQSRGPIIRHVIGRKFGLTDHSAKRLNDLKVAYWRLLYSHCPKAYEGRITLIVNEEQARFDPDLGWKGVAQGGLDVHQVPGSHETMMSLHGKEVADLLLNSIDEAMMPSSEQPDPTGVSVC